MPNYKLPLIDRFIKESYKFSYVKAINIAVIHGRSLKIRGKLCFSSRYTEILEVQGVKDKDITVFTNLPGMLGIDNTLPDVYQEEYILYNRQTKGAILDFFNIFYERMAQLRYRFLVRNNLPNASGSVDKSLAGRLMQYLSGYSNVRDFYCSVKAYLPLQVIISGHNLFWNAKRSVLGLKILLRDFFNLPIEIEEFKGRILEVPISEQTRIGTKCGKYNKLGYSAILDRKFYKSDNGITVTIGELDYEQYINFLPKTAIKDRPFSNLSKLKELIRMYVPMDIAVTIRIVLKSGCVNGAVLNGAHALNNNAFIMGHNEGEVYSEVL